MAILGYDTKGSAGIGAANARLLLSSFALATAGTLQELHGWFGPAAAVGAQFRVVIYDDDGGSGEPGTRLAYTNVFTYSGDSHVSQTGFSVPLAAGNYWVGYYCIVTGSGTAGVCYGETTGTASRRFNSSPDPPPNPAVAGGTVGTSKLSCWAVVSATPTTTTARFKRLKLGTGISGSDLGGGSIQLANSAPVPIGGTTGDVLSKASGTDYDTGWQKIANANVAAAAGIDVSKLAPGTPAQVLRSFGGAAVWTPGEVAYAEITSTVAVSATTEAGANTIVSLPATTFDGNGVLFEFYTPFVTVTTLGQFLFLTIFDGSTPIGRIAAVLAQVAGGGHAVNGRFRGAPSSGSHTYSVRGHTNGGTGNVFAGGGGSGAYLPAFLRVARNI